MASDTNLIDPLDLPVPGLPEALDGLRIAHLSDLHIHRPRRRYRQIAQAVRDSGADLVLFTGDYITRPGDEQVGLTVMSEICDGLAARCGVLGVFGNHDTPQLRCRFEALPIHWLDNASHRFDDLPLEVLGFETDDERLPDSLSTLAHLSNGNGHAVHPKRRGGQAGRLRLLLSHYPTYLPIASDLGVDLMFSGHTHGGQCRVPGVAPVYNSTDFPGRLTSGILRHRDTVCVVSRGLGEHILPFRVFCPPHIPLYTLRPGPHPGEFCDHVNNVAPW